MSGERPPKRSRSSSDADVGRGQNTRDEPALPVAARDDEFWLEDGNIVLLSTPHNVAFRVYRGLLVAQSTVFADMFASSSSRADEFMDGCPVVRLSDSPEDLRHLLGVLFPKSRRFFYLDDGDPSPTFEQVAAIIRLAHKYLVEDVLRQALSLLRSDFTDSFDVYDGECAQLTYKNYNAAAIYTVNLARLTETPSMLPVALYACCVLGGAIMDGYTREDGVVEYLGSEDLKRCIDGRNGLAKEALSTVLTIFGRTESVHCKTPSTCRAALGRLFEYAVQANEATTADVLHTWEETINVRTQEAELCSECTEEMLKRDVEARKKVWLRLPELFGVEIEGWGKPIDDESSGDP